MTVAKHRRIVAKVEQLMALVDALETQFAATQRDVGAILSAHDEPMENSQRHIRVLPVDRSRLAT